MGNRVEVFAPQCIQGICTWEVEEDLKSEKDWHFCPVQVDRGICLWV